MNDFAVKVRKNGELGGKRGWSGMKWFVVGRMGFYDLCCFMRMIGNYAYDLK